MLLSLVPLEFVCPVGGSGARTTFAVILTTASLLKRKGGYARYLQDQRDAEDRSWTRTLRGLDQSTIILQAQALRQNHSCTVHLPSNTDEIRSSPTRHNGLNIHFVIDFDDGVKWLVRARQAHDDCPPADLQEMVTKSEVITMQVLKGAGAKVPNAWMPPSLDPVADVIKASGTVDCFFIEFLPGDAIVKDFAPLTIDKINSSFAENYISDLAQFHQTISQINLGPHIKGIGSLYPSSSSTFATEKGGYEYIVGPLIQRSFLMIPNPPYFFGPFNSQKDRYLTKIDLGLNYIVAGNLWVWHPVDGYMMLLEVKELVEGCEELAREETEFFIKHGEDRNDQYMFLEDGHTSGAIDWERAIVTSKAEAFCAHLDLYHDQTFLDGRNVLTREEHLLIEAHERAGRSDLADCVRNGRLYQRLEWILFPRHPFAPVRVTDLNGIYDAFSGDDKEGEKGPLFGSFEDWRQIMLDKYEDDKRLKVLVGRGKAKAARAEKEAKQETEIRSRLLKTCTKKDDRSDTAVAEKPEKEVISEAEQGSNSQCR
nr:uncharacterized protein CI109_005221 [Kwoniella shandongensis]KAA5526452.1 hypothetical protein CI109_005221 [Kwoniella shandongensis]